ncbi:MAG: hypothetical protein ACRCTZ_22100, partial [Sarcina sp.]
VPMYLSEGEIFMGSDELKGVFVYDRAEFEELGYYVEESFTLNNDQLTILTDLVEDLLDDKVMSEDIHSEEEITEYDEFLLTLNDLDEYVKAMRELSNNGIKGLPIVSLVDECMCICKDLEQIAMSEE